VRYLVVGYVRVQNSVNITGNSRALQGSRDSNRGKELKEEVYLNS
jgi:hypothetical protein